MKRNSTHAGRRLMDDVLAAVAREPGVRSAEIGVIADDGAIVLIGFVSTHRARVHAERAARRTSGVTAVTNHLEVLP
jgi:osmotically-inducible protein OsmY